MKFKIDVTYTVWRTIEIDIDVDKHDLEQHADDLSQITGLGMFEVDGVLDGIDIDLWQTTSEPDEWMITQA